MTGQSDIPKDVRRTLLPTKDELLALRQKAIAKKQEEAAVENAVWLDEKQLEISQKIREAVSKCDGSTDLVFQEFCPSLVDYQRKLLCDLLKNSDLPHTWTDGGLVIHLNFLPQFDHSTQQCIPAADDLAGHVDKRIPEIASKMCNADDDRIIAELDGKVAELDRKMLKEVDLDHPRFLIRLNNAEINPSGFWDEDDEKWINIYIAHLKKKFSDLTQSEHHVVVHDTNQKRILRLQEFLNACRFNNCKIYKSKAHRLYHMIFPVNDHFVASVAHLNQHWVIHV